jgi:hypothetical protein
MSLTLYAQRNIPNIPNETNRKRLSYSAVPFLVYTTISLTARSMKAQHAYMHTHTYNSAYIHAYTHARIHDSATYLHRHNIINKNPFWSASCHCRLVNLSYHPAISISPQPMPSLNLSSCFLPWYCIFDNTDILSALSLLSNFTISGLIRCYHPDIYHLRGGIICACFILAAWFVCVVSYCLCVHTTW